MDSMMHDVVRRGTASRALALKRGDLAGKTGTTNDFVDAWFCGYQPTLVGVAWIGFDQPKKARQRRDGRFAALPIWIGYMEKALKDVPESFMPTPEGLISHQFRPKAPERPTRARADLQGKPAAAPAAG
jgi:penicillin-binding protein 1A